ncbi:MAG TPA: DUF4384 domain-containing protein [Gemmatimonadales bacterium]|nr:DUF4384 domain-containing protein [Gemmatimonadales bacterium]
MLLTALALALNTPLVAPQPVRANLASDDPPIRVWLNDDNYQPGDRATVKFKVSDDGYVVVLQADTRGHLRVLFPLDPNADNFVKGGKTFEVRARGDRDAFQVDDYSGTGTVFAAVSPQPFTFSSYVLGDHWDYKVLDGEDLGTDPEASMVDIVHGMAGPNHYDYDVTTYTVATQVSYSGGGSYYTPSYYPAYYPCWGCGPWYGGSGVFFNVGFGYPYGFYDSCFYDPFFCDGFGVPFYGAYYHRPFYGYGFRPRYAFYSPRTYAPFTGTYRPPFSGTRTTVTAGVGVRNRWAGNGGAPFARGGRTASPNGSQGSEPGRRGGSFGGAVEPRSRPAPTARPSSPPADRGNRGSPEPRRGRGNNDQSFTRPNQPIRQEPMRPQPRMESPRPESRPAPRMESRPTPRMETRSAPAPSRSFSMPSAPRGGGFSAPRGGGGGGGGGGGRGGRHGR